MQTYIPDRWKIVKLKSPQYGEIYKILASWTGAYADPDFWKLSSGFVDFKEDEEKYSTNQISGSIYILNKEFEGTSSLINSMFESFKKNLETNASTIEYIDAKEFYKLFNK